LNADAPLNWPMRETQCFQFGGMCEYHDIDRVTPAARPAVMQSDFVFSDPWTPYKPAKEAVDAK